MLDRIKRTSQRFLKDVSHGNHVESYVVALAALVFAFLTTVGENLVSNDLKMAAILAALGLLVYNQTVPEPSDTSVDDFLNDREKFVPLSELIKDANTLWIYGPSAINILNDTNTRAIQREILDHKEGCCRVIIQNPHEKEEVKRLEQQLDQGTTYRVQKLPKALQDTIEILKNIAAWQCPGDFSYRFLKYNPGFSIVVVDPGTSKGVVIVEFYGYTHEHTASRMHIRLTSKDSERWYSYWVTQFERMWADAEEPDPHGNAPIHP